MPTPRATGRPAVDPGRSSRPDGQPRRRQGQRAQRPLGRDAQRRARTTPPVLTNGLKVNELGIDPTQAAAVEARKEQVADIGRYFGIPTHILNGPQGDTETYSNTESGNQDLVRYTLQNYIGAIEDGISDLLPGGRHMRHGHLAAAPGTMLAQAQTFNLATGGKAWMDPNDDVRPLFGLPPVEDPDTLNPPDRARSDGVHAVRRFQCPSTTTRLTRLQKEQRDLDRRRPRRPTSSTSATRSTRPPTTRTAARSRCRKVDPAMSWRTTSP